MEEKTSTSILQVPAHTSTSTSSGSPTPSEPIPIVNQPATEPDVRFCENVANDPALWPQVIPDNLRLFLTERGPIQIKKPNYPSDSNMRSFSDTYYSKKLQNNEIIHRVWLVYSTSSDSVFCFHCKLFNINVTAFNGPTGYKDWGHLSRNIERHEKSSGHICSLKKYLDLKNDLSKGQTVDSVNQAEIDREKKRWTAVLERIIEIIKFLAGQNIAFRGTTEKLYDPNNGNFLKLVESISNFDSTLSEHIARIQRAQHRMPHYLGHNIQNELISIIAEKIKTTIISLLKQCKYYSVILDCTPDISHQEQLTVIVRFIYLNPSTKRAEVREHFLGFLPVTDTTGQGLATYLLDFLKSCDIELDDLRGQGYDNGANMRGKNIGLQKKILDMNPRAFYVPCAAHSLNLVVNDAAKSSLEITNFFCIVQEIYAFFSASTSRWDVIMKQIPTLTLKPLSNTRWESRFDALRALRFNMDKIYDALYSIFTNNKYDSDTKNIASSLMAKLKSYRFICSVVIWYNILLKINIVSKNLQKSDVIISEATKMINLVKKDLEKYRTDSAFEQLLSDAKLIAEELECETEFKETARPRPRKRHFDYEAADEPILNPTNKFKVCFYFFLLDTAISKLNERFVLLAEHNSVFSLFQNIECWNKLEMHEKKSQCSRLQEKLTFKNRFDIDGEDLYNELELLPIFFPNASTSTPTDILSYIYSNNLISSFPNISTALRIYLTLPVTVAEGERSFSKLKLIKNYLRSTMTQDRLTNLAIISIESKIDIKINDLIKIFANSKARKIEFV